MGKVFFTTLGEVALCLGPTGEFLYIDDLNSLREFVLVLPIPSTLKILSLLILDLESKKHNKNGYYPKPRKPVTSYYHVIITSTHYEHK